MAKRKRARPASRKDSKPTYAELQKRLRDAERRKMELEQEVSDLKAQLDRGKGDDQGDDQGRAPSTPEKGTRRKETKEEAQGRTTRVATGRQIALPWRSAMYIRRMWFQDTPDGTNRNPPMSAYYRLGRPP